MADHGRAYTMEELRAQHVCASCDENVGTYQTDLGYVMCFYCREGRDQHVVQPYQPAPATWREALSLGALLLAFFLVVGLLI